jgi:hypothetical protein
MEDFNKEAVLRRVQKLLAIAQDSRANEHEALAAARQAETIMRRYQIDHADVIATSIKRGEDLGTEDVVVTAKDNGTAVEKVPSWCSFLAVRIGELHDCPIRFARVSTKKGLEQAVRFHGYTADVKVAGWMLQYLVDTVNRLCKEYRKHPRYITGGRSVMNAYRHGVVQGIMNSLVALKREKDAEMQVAVASRALVVVKANAIKEQYGDFSYRKANTKIADDYAFSDGARDGRAVNVRQTALNGPNTSTGTLRIN